MNEKPVELHPEAEREFLGALAWYGRQSPPAAEKFEDAIERAINMIEESPERWPVCFSRFRKFTLHDFPFMIFYRSETSRTFVLALAHCRRRPGYWKERA
ncbi:MAG: type II toxin-antitoxin system RelE/ParE family toxin [Candidatus Sulfotelmatobacter sp.]